MKILYGLAGEGFGHSSRARVLIRYLENKGHKVFILTHGQSLDILKRDGFKVIKVKGLKFTHNNGKIEKLKTIKKSFIISAVNIRHSLKIKRLMSKGFDLCITDMAPLVSIISTIYRLPLLSIDNQHLLVNFEVKAPKKYKRDFLMARLVTKTLAYRANWYIVINFAKAKVKKYYKQNTFLVPPIIRQRVKNIKVIKENFILVYLSKKDERLIKILKQINENFIVYGYNIEKKEKNLIFHRAGDHFLKDLAKCKAIIATSGFSLISEALYLKKPYFALPILHFEQALNGIFLKKSGFGDYSEKPSKKQIITFLKNLKNYEKNLKNYKVNHNRIFKILDKILKKIL